ncbi:MAG: hypothetical protein Q8S13_14615 [Dehalococcoidia bacterium]|nr:hypothetical protein [Dehalococcoidia bacterium]
MARLSFIENFVRPPALNAAIAVTNNLDWEILGLNAVTASATCATGGGINLVTTGAANDQIIIRPHLDASQTAWDDMTWDTASLLTVKFHLRLVDITDVIIEAGLRPTPTAMDVGTDNDKLILRVTTATDTIWRVVESIANTDTTTVTGIPLAADNLDFSFEINAARGYTVKINRIPVLRGNALTSGSIGVPYVGLQTLAVATKNIRILRIAGSLEPAT